MPDGAAGDASPVDAGASLPLPHLTASAATGFAGTFPVATGGAITAMTAGRRASPMPTTNGAPSPFPHITVYLPGVTAPAATGIAGMIPVATGGAITAMTAGRRASPMPATNGAPSPFPHITVYLPGVTAPAATGTGIAGMIPVATGGAITAMTAESRASPMPATVVAVTHRSCKYAFGSASYRAGENTEVERVTGAVDTSAHADAPGATGMHKYKRGGGGRGRDRDRCALSSTS
jgi:hypothetical protein